MADDDDPVVVRDGVERLLEPCVLGTAVLRDDVVVEVALPVGRVLALTVPPRTRVPTLRVLAPVRRDARVAIDEDESGVVRVCQLQPFRVVVGRKLPAIVVWGLVAELRLHVVGIVVVAEDAVPRDVQRWICEYVLKINFPLGIRDVAHAAVVEVVPRVDDELRLQRGSRLPKLFGNFNLVGSVVVVRIRGDAGTAPVADGNEGDCCRNDVKHRSRNKESKPGHGNKGTEGARQKFGCNGPWDKMD
mmetsp:Transcript_16642/g.37495  ORF Transcript_16642/g.37495 Transcript_16642/m.37495 type:complete len:246 (+) Transcript_16642:614-1351(+)